MGENCGGMDGKICNPPHKSENRNLVGMTCDVWSEGLQQELPMRDKKRKYFAFREIVFFCEMLLIVGSNNTKNK